MEIKLSSNKAQDSCFTSLANIHSGLTNAMCIRNLCCNAEKSKFTS